MTGCESNQQSLGYESDTLPLDHCTTKARYNDALALSKLFGFVLVICGPP